MNSTQIQNNRVGNGYGKVGHRARPRTNESFGRQSRGIQRGGKGRIKLRRKDGESKKRKGGNDSVNCEGPNTQDIGQGQ